MRENELLIASEGKETREYGHPWGSDEQIPRSFPRGLVHAWNPTAQATECGIWIIALQVWRQHQWSSGAYDRCSDCVTITAVAV